MPLRANAESNSSRERDAFNRGIHDRRKGQDRDTNPHVRSDIDHEPNLYEKWDEGWVSANRRIESESNDLEEYDE